MDTQNKRSQITDETFVLMGDDVPEEIIRGQLKEIVGLGNAILIGPQVDGYPNITKALQEIVDRAKIALDELPSELDGLPS